MQWACAFVKLFNGHTPGELTGNERQDSLLFFEATDWAVLHWRKLSRKKDENNAELRGKNEKRKFFLLSIVTGHLEAGANKMDELPALARTSAWRFSFFFFFFFYVQWDVAWAPAPAQDSIGSSRCEQTEEDKVVRRREEGCLFLFHLDCSREFHIYWESLEQMCPTGSGILHSCKSFRQLCAVNIAEHHPLRSHRITNTISHHPDWNALWF